MSKKMIRSFAAFALVLCMLLTNLGGWNLALAEETQVEKSEEVKETNETKEKPQVKEEEHKEEPQVEEPQDDNKEGKEEAKDPSEEVQEDKVKPLEQNTEAKDNLGLDIGGEIVPQAVGAGIDVKAPTIDPVFYDATTISGGNLAKAKVEVGNKKQTVIATVHVTLKGEDGTVKATLSDSPTSGTKWKVNLPEGVKVAKGDTVTVYQQIGEDKSPEVNVTAQPSKASTVTLTMPEGEIWIEQTSSNIVSEDEKAEAIDLLKKANPTIANDIESVEFKISGTDPKTASYTVTYTDKSKTEEIQAPGLTVKQVTEYSRSPEIGSITIVDNVVKGKLAGPGPFDGIKVQLILNVNKDKAGQYCNENKCTVDKDSSKPVEVTVQEDGTFSYTLQDRESLTLDQIVGVSVKEPHKFVSCSTTTVKPAPVEKTKVKDPRKLTAKDKEAIDAAIRKAYTAKDGTSKLPNGTGDWDGVPAVIQIDDNGNVKIFSGNDVAGNWDWNNGGIFVPEKNDDGSVKIKEGAEPKITILAKDLLLNKAPDAPTVAHDADKNEITITTNPADTDAKKIAIKYTPEGGTEETTVEVTKGEGGNWAAPEGFTVSIVTVDEDEEKKVVVVSFKDDKIKNKTKVTASVTDAGGIDETNEEDNAPKNSGDGIKEIKILPKKPAIKVDEKTGDVTITPVEKDKDRIAKKMDITYTPVGESETKTKTVTAERDEDGKWSVPEDSGFKVNDDGKTIIVPNGLIKHNTSVTAKTNDGDTSDTLTSEVAEVKKVDDKTKPNPPKVGLEKDTSNLNITPPVDKDTTSVTVTYKKADGTKVTIVAKKADNKWTLKGENGAELTNGETINASTGVITIPKGNYKAGEEVTAYGNDEANNKSDDDKKTPVEVTFDVNGGKQNIDSSILLKGGNFVLPAIYDKQYFPDGKEFNGWQVGNETKKAGDNITINVNTKIKALWKSNKPVTPPSPNPDPNPGQDPGYYPDPDDYRPHRPHRPSTPDKDKDKDKDSSDKSIIRLERGTHYRYIYGYPDGTVRPEGLITRAEAAALIARIAMLDMSDKAKPNFKDTPSMWYNSAINVVVKKNLMLADDGKFRPNEAITRAEFARALFYIDAKNAAVAPFADVKGHKFEEAINQAYGNGRIAGYPDGTFRPDAFIKRAEAAKILNHYAKRGVDHDGMKGVEVYTTHFTDLNERYWGYYEIMEAANTHEYERRVNTILETWTKINNK